MKFREWIRSSLFFEGDLFGFEHEKRDEAPDDSSLHRPIDQFDVELMMEFLKKKTVVTHTGDLIFPNVMQWGSSPGAVKLEVDPGYRVSIKKLGVDKAGNPRWVTKRMFQLNRQGFGGYEDSVAQEVFEYVEDAAQCMIEAPTEDYKDLENLVDNIYHKLKRTAKEIFIPEGVRKLHDDAYVIKFGVRGHGLESRSQRRVEQNQTLVAYDREQGTIRVTNYNLLSRTGRAHEFKISQNELDAYFFPTQDRDEISEVVAVRMKYY
jgi:hypothetical protein